MTHASPTLAAAIADRRLVVFVGQGGVGKTSLSAAVAYGRALGGDGVGVLTVDPAPRLGDALGLAAIDEIPRRVPLPADARGRLVAMRLDSKGTFDRMVERYSASAEAARALLAHPIYRAISTQLGGAENYMAFQRLYELVEQRENDALVVDTPPAVNVAAMLAAPAKLSGLLDTGAMAILAEPALVVARAGGALARVALSVVLAALERVTGSSLQRDVADFVALAGDLLGGLGERAGKIDELLRSKDTAFVLVTRPREHDVLAALEFRRDLARAGIPIAAVVANRVTPSPGNAVGLSQQDRLAALPARLHDAVRRMEDDMQSLRAMEAAAIARLRDALSGADDPPLFEVTGRPCDVASLEDIAALANDLGY